MKYFLVHGDDEYDVNIKNFWMENCFYDLISFNTILINFH